VDDRERAEGVWQGRAAARIDAGRPPLRIAPDVAHELLAHARECYPEECCGLVLGAALARARVVRCTNVQSQRQSRGDSVLDATQAFWIDDRELLIALREAERRGERLVAVYHSHVNTAAYLSHTDLEGALSPDGEPLWPGTAYLVVSVFEHGAREVGCFEWDVETRRFAGRGVQWSGA
jgi:proteasome lid subunit RPN8/RPN11